MCDTGLSGGGPALQLTVHSTHQPPSVQLACTVHTLPSLILEGKLETCQHLGPWISADSGQTQLRQKDNYFGHRLSAFILFVCFV